MDYVTIMHNVCSSVRNDAQYYNIIQAYTSSQHTTIKYLVVIIIMEYILQEIVRKNA